MALLNLFGRKDEPAGLSPRLADTIRGYSIEVMPRTAAKIEDFRALLPRGTLVYIAHIDGTPIEEMVETARRLRDEGFDVMPHFPARIIPDATVLKDWILRYRNEAGVERGLLLAGGVAAPRGAFDSSIGLMETGLFDRHGFRALHVAGHPEGNRDIDPDGGTKAVDEALRWKQAFSERTDASMAIVTQFLFDPAPALEWSQRIAAAGVNLPIHLGIAGPTKLSTLIKFAIACGVGPSLQVLQKRAMDVSKLLVPFTPDEVLAGIADWQANHPDSAIRRIHVFPLGGIRASAEWMNDRAGLAPAAAERDRAGG
ncbi:methylenetetrahydrofolate reductase [Plastorhodobacter daqingensis]|uniref:Methylenetetrahydrofolate reductase n=1 Tax=Plastorhodobacter daqingensis TaxID=1387281 RepID=A0ABW2UMB0_9RHOB